MTNVDQCLICGATIPEGAQVCKSCAEQFSIEAGEAVEIAEEMRDIAGGVVNYRKYRRQY